MLFCTAKTRLITEAQGSCLLIKCFANAEDRSRWAKAMGSRLLQEASGGPCGCPNPSMCSQAQANGERDSMASYIMRMHSRTKLRGFVFVL